MKNIEIVTGESDTALFNIGGYSFIEQETERFQEIPIFRMVVAKHFESVLDVRYWLEDIFDDEFLLNIPSELTEYIKKYEENIRFTDRYLFHDLRTRYIDFLHLCSNTEPSDSVAFIGYTLLDNETCFAIKAFKLNDLVLLVEAISKHCHKSSVCFETTENLRWIQLQQYLLPDRNLSRNDICDSFLKKTLNKEYCKIFLDAFKTLDLKGYLDQKFYDHPIVINGHQTIIRDCKQFTKYFSRFWKTDISDIVANKTQTILCLHDELPNDDSKDNIVYTIKPYLKQYYQLNWFEDFCAEIISEINIPGFKILSSYAGRHFDFFQRGKDSDIRELDFIFGVQHGDIYKIIAIECKKTLSDTEITRTNRAIREKILKSHMSIIDAYIHIGCFNNGVVFDKDIDEKANAYKQGILQVQDDPDAIDAPYFSFAISSIDDFESKLSYIIKHIFKEW